MHLKSEKGIQDKVISINELDLKDHENELKQSTTYAVLVAHLVATNDVFIGLKAFECK